MTRFDLADDHSLLELLAETLNEMDTVPDDAVSAAVVLAQLGDADSELATLVADTLVDNDVVLFRHDLAVELQGGATARLITFATPELTVDIDLEANGAHLAGAIMPPASLDVDLDTTEGTVTVRSDELGRFQFEVGPGRCRLRVHAPGGAVVTPWITR